MLSFILVSAFFVLVASCHATPSDENLFFHLMTKRQMHICGHDLADALSLVCNGVFRKRNLHRRHVNDGVYTDSLANFYFLLRDMDDAADYEAPHSKPATSAALVRVARQVSDECCKNTCNYYKLRSYCGTKE